MAAAASVEAIKLILESFVKTGRFAKHLSRVQIISGGNGSVTASMKVELEDCNNVGILHGAFATLLVDNISSVALLTLPNAISSGQSGVSVQLNMTYMKAVPAGEEILIKATTDKVGKKLAFLTVDILNLKNNDLLARGSHTKYIGGK